ncbi:MAG: hypothetical protein JSS87_01795 [Acidobacteria bacterium]|nr:hypothetical protein [Acidobacteriota bacterium]
MSKVAAVEKNEVVKRQAVQEQVGSEPAAAGARKRRKLQRGSCKEFLQKEVSSILEEAVDKLKEKILAGDAGALKTLWQMSGLEKEPSITRRSRSNTARQILKELDEHAVEDEPGEMDERQEG